MVEGSLLTVHGWKDSELHKGAMRRTTSAARTFSSPQLGLSMTCTTSSSSRSISASFRYPSKSGRANTQRFFPVSLPWYRARSTRAKFSAKVRLGS